MSWRFRACRPLEEGSSALRPTPHRFYEAFSSFYQFTTVTSLLRFPHSWSSFSHKMPAAKRKATASPPANAASDNDGAGLEIEEQHLDIIGEGGETAQKRANNASTAAASLSTESALRRLPLDTLEQLLPLQKRRCLETLVGGLPPLPSSSSSSAALPPTTRLTSEEEDAAVFTDTPRPNLQEQSELTRLHASSCVGLQEDWFTLHTMLKATVTAQESNSCLLIGASGSGKSLLVDSVLQSISQASTTGNQEKEKGGRPYYHVHLAGTVQINDRSAMKEMAQQLILQGAFTEDDVGDAMGAGSLDADEEDEEEVGARGKGAADHVFGGDADEDDEDANNAAALAAADEEAEIQDELAGAILSSLNNIIAHIIALLSNTASTSASSQGGRKPLIITLDDFDLFTARPRQAMLYCLLDAVQAASYGAGLAVIGLTSRVDTVDLLEKRVKSRFSHRILHVRPPSSYDVFGRIVQNALSSLPLPFSTNKGGEESISIETHDAFTQAWSKDLSLLFSHPHFRSILRGIYELSNDIRMIYRILTPTIASLTVLEPSFDLESLVETAATEVGDGMIHVLRDLTEPEMALLIAVKHLQTRDRQVFNFEMCFDELRRFAARDARERQAASTGAALVDSSTTSSSNTIPAQEAQEERYQGQRSPPLSTQTAKSHSCPSTPSSTSKFSYPRTMLPHSRFPTQSPNPALPPSQAPKPAEQTKTP